MIQPPAYVDGRFRLFRIEADENNDFPVEKLRDTKMDIWFSEISVFDRTRYELGRSGIEVTMKIRIAQYKKINSQCMCMIDGEMHRVYNAAHITNKDGFPETELTLIKPDKKMEILK